MTEVNPVGVSRFESLLPAQKIFIDASLKGARLSVALAMAGLDSRNTAIVVRWVSDLDFQVALKERAEELKAQVTAQLVDMQESMLILSTIARESDDDQTRIKAILALDKLRNPRQHQTINNFDLKGILDSVEKHRPVYDDWSNKR